MGEAPTQQLSRAQLEGRFGLAEPSAERLQPIEYEVWEDCWSAVLVFDALRTQWITAPFGGVPSGLRYEVIPVVLRLRGVPRSEWADVFESLRVMERAALALFARRVKAG